MTQRLLDDLIGSLGFEPTSEAEIVGSDPILATRFRVSDAAAAALAATGLAAAEIWSLRTGRPQRVRVETIGAAASLIGFALQRLENGGAEAMFDHTAQLTDFYPTRDGQWFLFHEGFPNTTRKALALLGAKHDRESVAAKIADWDAQALEDVIAEHGLCGARVGTSAEWASHPQGKALAGQPMVEVIRVADSPPEPFALGACPLSGVRVLDLTRVLAGPTCGRTLAAHGAEVLRIGSPNLPSFTPFDIDTGHGKRSAFADLETAVGIQTLRGLVRNADVFTQSYRSGALAQRGFGPEELFALRPGLIYTSINCYGHVGPWADRPGWEQLAQAVTGIAAEQGGDSRPQLLPAAATDYTTGYLAALGTMIALARRAREGGSYLVRVSLCQTGMWLSQLTRSETLGAGLSPAAAMMVRPFMTRSETPFGALLHLGPVLELSETAPRWELPTVPLGTHPASWMSHAII